MSRTKKKNEQKKKDVTRKEREKDDADGGGEKKSIHTRKTSEFSRMRIAYLRQTGFNGKIAFLYVRAPTHFVYFCVLCVLARARAFCRKSVTFWWKSFLFFSSFCQFSWHVREWSNAREIAIWHSTIFDDVLFFLMRRWWEMFFFFWAMCMGACICLLEKWMMDDSRASVVVYNFISIYYHLHLNL